MPIYRNNREKLSPTSIEYIRIVHMLVEWKSHIVNNKIINPAIDNPGFSTLIWDYNSNKDNLGFFSEWLPGLVVTSYLWYDLWCWVFGEFIQCSCLTLKRKKHTHTHKCHIGAWIDHQSGCLYLLYIFQYISIIFGDFIVSMYA